MAIQLTDASVLVNDEAIIIESNTLSFQEGRGEQTVRAGSVGNGVTEPIYAKDMSTRISVITFQMPTTPQNIDLALGWKDGDNTNTVQIAGSTPEGDTTRTMTQAALLTDYVVNVGAEGTIDIEFKGNPLI